MPVDFYSPDQPRGQPGNAGQWGPGGDSAGQSVNPAVPKAGRTAPAVTVKEEKNASGRKVVFFHVATDEKSRIRAFVTADAVRIKSTFVSDSQRGKGWGIALYEKAIDYAHSKGLRLESDEFVSADAVRVWDALARRGYAVVRHEATRDSEGGLNAVQDKGSVFSLVPGIKESTAHPHAATFYSPDQPRDERGRWGEGGGATTAPTRSGESNKAFERRIGGHVEDRPADPRYHSPLRQGIEAHAVTLLASAKLRDVPAGEVTLTFKPRYAMTTIWRGDHPLAHIGPAPDGGVTVSSGIANSRKRDVVIHPETPPAEAEGLLRRALGLKPSRPASFAASPSRTMERAIDSGRDRMQELASQLQAGTLTLGQWQQASTAELKSLHIMGALAGSGGDTLDHDQRQAVSAKLNEQSAYLWNLAGQIARGEQPLDGRFIARAGMYADAARNTFSEAERGQAAADGMRWERRVTNPELENCEDCLAYEAQGWVPLGTLPAPGEGSRCLVHCACGMEYSDSAEQPADDAEPDEETPPEEEEADVPEPAEDQTSIEEQLTEPVGNQPPSDDEMADRIIAAATDYLESGPIREPRHQVSDAQAHKRHIAGIVNRIDEISLDAAQKVHAALGLEGDGTTKAHIRRALAAYLRNGYAG